MICKNCGAEVAEGSAFCGSCGSKIEPAETDGTKDVVYEDNANNYSGDNTSDNNYADNNYPDGNIADNGNDADATPQQKPPLIKKEWIPMIISAAVVVVAAIFILAPKFMQPNKPASGNKSNASGYTASESQTSTAKETTSSTVVPDTKNNAPMPDMKHIESLLSSSGYGSNAAVSIVDLKTGAIYNTSNAQTPMSASALTTVPLIYTADAVTDNRNVSLTDIKVTYRHLSSGRGIMSKEQDGATFDLDYLIKNLMMYSDNNITNSLMDYFGMQQIREVCSKNGYNSVTFQRHIGEQIPNKDNYISAYDAARMMADLYLNGTNISRTYLRSNFRIADSLRYAGIAKYLPSSETVLNHNAFTKEIYNEVCIIPDAENPYVISFISNRANYEVMEKVAADISQYVYSQFGQ